MTSHRAPQLAAIAASILLLATSPAQDAKFATDNLQYSRDFYAKVHFIAIAKLPTPFKYDRYPSGGPERIQCDEGTYSRQRGKAWLHSNDRGRSGEPIDHAERDRFVMTFALRNSWGRTGEAVDKETARKLDGWIKLVDAALNAAPIAVKLADKSEDARAQWVFEAPSENPGGVPTRFTFRKPLSDRNANVLLHEFSGSIRFEGTKVVPGGAADMVRLGFGYMMNSDGGYEVSNSSGRKCRNPKLKRVRANQRSRHRLSSRKDSERMKRIPAFVACVIFVVQAQASIAVKIENAKSPNGKYTLEAIGEKDADGCRIEIKALPGGKIVNRFSHADFDASDQRYTISALWKEDSGAFALNITEGRNITLCRVFAFDRGSWREASLPEKAIDKVRAKGNTADGKAQDYLYASEWMPNNRLKFSYQGNIGNEDEFICRLVRGGKPRLEFVQPIAREPEPEVKLDYENYVFSVLAGGSNGSKDGLGVAAQFKWPHGLTVDPAGNVFVADRGNHLIRKITRDGTVSTLAGSPEKYGRVDGIGDAARFWYPVGMAVDTSGNVYVADSSGQAIRKVTPTGAVSTLAATPETATTKLGFGDVEHFHNPTGVVVDKDGNVFVADSNNFVIRKIAPDGTVTTAAGLPGTEGTTDGEAKAARFVAPTGVTLDGKGNLYVSDKLTIRKIDGRGVVSTLAGSPDQAGNTDGVGSAARFANPIAIASDSAGNVYVADSGNKNVRKITPGGAVKTLRDIRNESPFIKPVAVAVDDKDQIYVADEDGFRIVAGKPTK